MFYMLRFASILLKEQNLYSMSLQNGANIAQIVSAGLIGCLTIISVVVSIKAFKDGKNRKSREKAIELAHYFQQEIISKIEFLDIVFDETKADELINTSFPPDKIRRFDRAELMKLSHNQNIIDAVEKEIEKIPIENIVNAKVITSKTAVEALRLDALFKRTIFISPSKNAEPDSSEGQLSEKTRLYIKTTTELALRLELDQLISDLMNILEWFSMNLISGVADERIVYQSLHQLFLSSVYRLYYFISKNNDLNSEKYYTNIIALFSCWKTRKEKSISKESAMNEIAESEKKKLVFSNKPLK